MKRVFFFLAALPIFAVACRTKAPVFEGADAIVDGAAKIHEYVTEFNSHDEELYVQEFPDSRAEYFLDKYIPVFDCPDKELEKTYYFRWWTFRKHIKFTNGTGYIITEFLPDVSWAGKFNSICCPASHHFSEGRWLRDTDYLNDYARFWVSSDASPRSYSFPAADAVLRYYKVHPNMKLIRDVYPGLKDLYAGWESDHRDSTGLFFQLDGADGMEVSISGSLSPDQTGYRATINSYMYADAVALSTMAEMLGKSEDAVLYKAKADTIKTLIDTMLWDEDARFYKVIPRHGDMSFSPARELHGYVPWVYDIPGADKTDAWLQLMDPQGFKAPFGPTTAEQRAEGFKVVYEGHECQWNGPSWPFATAQTLTGLANTLHRFGEGVVTKADYFETLQTYSNSHRMTLSSGEKVCWIDENLNPYTGDWIARTMLMASPTNKYKERGKDYNHSTFNDLIISGLIGLQPQLDGSIVIEPLIPEGEWDYFYLSGINCADKDITVFYDKTGNRYNVGKGLFVYIDGKPAAHSKTYSTKIVI